MKLKIVAIFCILLIVASPITVYAETESKNSYQTNYEEQAGQAIVINVDKTEPRIVPSSVLENQNTPVYVFLKGATLGSLISGSNSPKIAPLYGTPPISIVNIVGDSNSNQKASFQYIPPIKRQFLSQDGFIDLGYLAVVLKRIPQENKVPDEIVLNLTANIRFETDAGFGEFGQEDMVLTEQSDEKAWKNDAGQQQKFWGGKGYIRASKIDKDQVSLAIYDSRLNNIGSMYFNKLGDTKGPINLGGGFFLYDNFRVQFSGTKIPQDKIILKIIRDNKVIDKTITVGERIYPGSDWKLIDIKESLSGLQEAIIRNSNGNIKVLRLVPIYDIKSDGSKIILDKDVSSYLDKVSYKINSDDLQNYLKNILSPYESYVQQYSQQFGVNPNLVKAVIYQESRGNPDASRNEPQINDASYGLMQLLSNTAKNIAKELNYKSPDQLTVNELKNPETNIQLGTKYLSDGLKANNNDILTALRYYNGGPNGPKNPNTLSYANDVFNLYSAISKYYGDITMISLEADCTEMDVYSNDDLANLVPDKKKLYCTSIDELKQIINDNPTSTNIDETNYYLGKNYEGLGSYNKALSYYENIKPGTLYYENALVAIDNLQNKISRKVNSEEIYLEDEESYVSLQKIKKTRPEEMALASINVDNNPMKELKKDETLIPNAIDKNSVEYNWVIEEITDSSVKIRQRYTDHYGISEILNLKDIRKIDVDEKNKRKADVQVTGINTKQEAYITILPGSGRAVSTSDFKVHVPIEKRAFSLAPQQIDYQINQTRKIIEDLDKIINRLDNTIRVWKATCFGVFGILTLKNLLQGSIHARARQIALNGMDGESGWKRFCTENSKAGNSNGYVNYEDCIFKNSNIINQQIDDTQNNLEEFKKESQDYKNQNFYKDEYSKYQTPNGLDIISKDEVMKKRLIDKQLEDANNRLSKLDKEKDKIAYLIEKDNVKTLEKEEKNIDDEISRKKAAYEGANNFIKQGDISKQSKDEQNKAFETKFDELSKKQLVEPVGIQRTSAIYLGRLKDEKGEEETYLYYYNDEGVLSNVTEAKKSNYLKYLEDLKKDSASDKKLNIQKQIDSLNILKDDEIVRLNDGRTIYQSLDKNNNPVPDKFIFAYSDLSSNRIRRDYAKEAHVEYYEDGKPYCIPTKEGNFAKVLEYYANGPPKTISEWNVGPDGLLCTNDDILLTSEDVFLKLSDQTTQSKSNDLKSTVNRAGICKSDGQRVSGLVGREWLCSQARAKIESTLTQSQCSDFMDIGDCQIMFNVCDPVVCPSSRYDLGGRWPLGKRSVAETGVIGSLVLGMPNWVVFGGSQITPPVCVTGVSAGLQAWRSVFQGYAECLQVSKVKQENVGICDKIRSVFMCELLWREGIAIFDVNKGVFSLGAEALFGKGNTDKGGGEYLTFKDSFDNAANSFKFFTEDYGKNAFAAYKARSTEEFGTQVCKAAIFGKSPGVGKFFDELTAPESPPQFTAFFDVYPWTSNAGITISGRDPGLLSQAEEQSRYQIYYHIYAGQNSDTYYSVFLTDKFGRSLYVTDCSSQLKQRDIIQSGGYVDKTCDITARSGYDQVCVSVNNRVECGFGKVTTGFSLNYLSDQFVKNEALREITSAEECRPSEPRLTPAVNIGTTLPNEGLISTGIVRVCNPTNPGAGTNPNDWKLVGTCGKNEQNQDLGSCWLDARTVKINDILDRKEIIKDIEQRGFDINKQNFSTSDKLNSLFDGLEKRFNDLFIVNNKIKLNLNPVQLNDKKIISFSDLIDGDTLTKIIDLIKYDENKNTEDKTSYRYLMSVSGDVDKSIAARLRVGEIYYALADFYSVYDNTLKSKSETQITQAQGNKEEPKIQEPLCVIEYDEANNPVNLFSPSDTNFYYRFNNGKWEFNIQVNKETSNVWLPTTTENCGKISSTFKIDINQVANFDPVYKEICNTFANPPDEPNGKDFTSGTGYLSFIANKNSDDFLIIHSKNNVRTEIGNGKADVNTINKLCEDKKTNVNSQLKIVKLILTQATYVSNQVTYIYTWNENEWVIDELGKSSKNSNYQEVLDYIKNKVGEEESKNNFNELDLYCGTNKLKVADKFNLFSIDVKSDLDKNIKNDCAEITQNNINTQGGELFNIRLVLGNNFFTDLINPDHIYSWDGKGWTANIKGNYLASIIYNIKDLETGFDSINKDINSNKDNLNRVELSCKTNGQTISINYNENIISTLKDRIKNTCGLDIKK